MPARKQAWMAPTEVPQTMSKSTGSPVRLGKVSSREAQDAGFVGAARSAPREDDGAADARRFGSSHVVRARQRSAQAFTRSEYSPVRVSTRIVSLP